MKLSSLVSYESSQPRIISSEKKFYRRVKKGSNNLAPYVQSFTMETSAGVNCTVMLDSKQFYSAILYR